MHKRPPRHALIFVALLLLIASCAQQEAPSTPGVWDATNWDAATWQ